MTEAQTDAEHHAASGAINGLLHNKELSWAILEFFFFFFQTRQTRNIPMAEGEHRVKGRFFFFLKMRKMSVCYPCLPLSYT